MAAGNLTGAIPAGRFIQKHGLLPALFCCFLLAPCIFSVRAVVLAFLFQIALAFFAGMVLSMWAVCISPTVAHTTSEEQRPFAFSLVFSLGIGAGALGGLAGSRLPGWFTNLHSTFHSLAPDQMTLLLACGIAVCAIVPALKLSLSRVELPEQTRPLLSPFLRRFLPAIAIWTLVVGSFSPFANVFFARHLHMPLRSIGTVFSVSQSMQVVAVLAVPLLFRRFGLIHGIVLTQLAACLCLCLLAIVSSPLAAAGIYIGLTASQWMNEPGLYSLLMDNVPAEQRGGASASNSLVMSVSLLIAAAVAGWAFDRYGYPRTLFCVAIVALFAAAFFRGVVGGARDRSVTAVEESPQ
jgi:MFS family permease